MPDSDAAAEKVAAVPTRPRRPPLRAITAAVACLVVVIGLNVGYTTWTNRQAHDQFVTSQKAAAQEARKQGDKVLSKLCRTLSKLNQDKPPTGNPQTNPSRGYLQRQHNDLTQLWSDIGCNKLKEKG